MLHANKYTAPGMWSVPRLLVHFDVSNAFIWPLPVCDLFIIRNNRLILAIGIFFGKLGGRHPAECRMETTLVLVSVQGLDFAPGILKRHEPVLVQAFLPLLLNADSALRRSPDIRGCKGRLPSAGAVVACQAARPRQNPYPRRDSDTAPEAAAVGLLRLRRSDSIC